MHAIQTLVPLLLLLPITAQAGGAPPSLVTDQHRILAQFAGTWTCKVTMVASGAAQPIEFTATQRATVVCGGLWLQSIVQGTFAGQALEGLSVLGFETAANKYVGIFIDSQSPSVARTEGSYDPATKTLELKTVAGDGPSRSVFTWQDADHSLQIGYGNGPDGKETEVMRIERTRASEPGAAPTAAPTPAPAAGATGTMKVAAEPPPATHPMAAVLRRLPGTWTCSMELPEGLKVPAREQVAAVCGGGWYWSDFHDGAGAFEGHRLWGYDVSTNLFVSYWIDSASTGFAELTGHYDEKADLLTMHGTSTDKVGQKQRRHETLAWPTEHQRVQTIDFSTGTRNLRMTLTYDRSQSTGAYRVDKKTP